MPDIAMCTTTDCPQKEKCYRYTAIPSYWQSYSLFEWQKVGSKITCDGFWNNKDRK